MPVTNASTTQDAAETTQESDPNHGEEAHSKAQQIAELQESLESDETQLHDLETEMENPQSEYSVAEREYRALFDQLDELDKKIEANKSNPLDLKMQLQLNSERASLARRTKLAQDRFDLAIEDRKTVKEQRATLKRKIENDKLALAELKGERSDDTASDESTESTQSDDKETSKNTTHSKSHRKADDDSAEQSAKDSDDRDKSSYQDADQSRTDSADEPEEEVVDEELKQAQAEAEEKENQAEEAQEETKSIAARLADLQGLINQEQKELLLAKKKVDLATATQQQFNEELVRRQAESASSNEIASLKQSISEASQRLIAARSDVSDVIERLNEHRAEFSSLQSEHILALHEAAKKKQEAEEAENRIEALKNPYTLRNITQWLIEHGPRLLIIILGMFILNRISSIFAYRSVQLVSKGSSRGSTIERENRAKTLVGVFQNAASVGVFVTGIIMVLEEVGANITVLMEGWPLSAWLLHLVLRISSRLLLWIRYVAREPIHAERYRSYRRGDRASRANHIANDSPSRL